MESAAIVFPIFKDILFYISVIHNAKVLCVANIVNKF